MAFKAKTDKKEKVLYFEQVSKEKGFKGQATQKSEESLQAEIRAMLGKLGGSVLSITPGEYDDELPVRTGYQIEFSFMGQKGRIYVAALPCKIKTNQPKANRMALFNVRDSLQSQYIMSLLTKDSAPLIPYLLVDENTTFSAQFLKGAEGGKFLPSGDVVDGELV